VCLRRPTPPPPPVTPLPSDAVGPLAAEVGGGDAGARGPTGGPCDTPPPGPPRYGAPLGRRISGFWLRRRDVSPRAALGFRPFASPVLNPPSFFSTPQFLPPPSPAPFARVAPQHRPPREGHCTPRQRRPVGHPGLDPPELCLPLALLSLPLLAPPPLGGRGPPAPVRPGGPAHAGVRRAVARTGAQCSTPNRWRVGGGLGLRRPRSPLTLADGRHRLPLPPSLRAAASCG